VTLFFPALYLPLIANTLVGTSYYATVVKLTWSVARDRTSDNHVISVKLAESTSFLYAFEESVDCVLLSSYCDDSNLHQVCTDLLATITMG